MLQSALEGDISNVYIFARSTHKYFRENVGSKITETCMLKLVSRILFAIISQKIKKKNRNKNLQ